MTDRYTCKLTSTKTDSQQDGWQIDRETDKQWKRRNNVNKVTQSDTYRNVIARQRKRQTDGEQ